MTTFVYADSVDLPYADRVCEVVEGSGGRVCFVQLLCSEDEHVQRFESPGRHELGKMSSAARV